MNGAINLKKQLCPFLLGSIFWLDKRTKKRFPKINQHFSTRKSNKNRKKCFPWVFFHVGTCNCFSVLWCFTIFFSSFCSFVFYNHRLLNRTFSACFLGCPKPTWRIFFSCVLARAVFPLGIFLAEKIFFVLRRFIISLLHSFVGC